MLTNATPETLPSFADVEMGAYAAGDSVHKIFWTAGLPTYVKDTDHALHIFDSFRFDTASPGHHFLFTMDVKSL